ADVNDQQQSASAQTEPAAQSAEVTIAIAASESVAAPALADNAPAPQPVEVSIVTTPAQAIAGTAPIDFAAAQREDVPLAAAVATHAPVASDAVVNWDRTRSRHDAPRARRVIGPDDGASRPFRITRVKAGKRSFRNRVGAGPGRAGTGRAGTRSG